jgi:hypothetical protein
MLFCTVLFYASLESKKLFCAFAVELIACLLHFPHKLHSHSYLIQNICSSTNQKTERNEKMNRRKYISLNYFQRKLRVVFCKQEKFHWSTNSYQPESPMTKKLWSPGKECWRLPTASGLVKLQALWQWPSIATLAQRIKRGENRQFLCTD